MIRELSILLLTLINIDIELLQTCLITNQPAPDSNKHSSPTPGSSTAELCLSLMPVVHHPDFSDLTRDASSTDEKSTICGVK
jgi:hypothetical protein